MTWCMKMEFTLQILCTNLKIPALKEKTPHNEMLSWVKIWNLFYTSIFQVPKLNWFFSGFWFLNHTFWSYEQIDKITKLCRKQHAISRFKKIIKSLPFGQFLCEKHYSQAQTIIFVHRLLQNHEMQCIMGKIHFREVSHLPFGWILWSVDNVIL